MNYKYAPIYKYGFILLTIYMLLKHQKLMSQDKLLINSIIITLIVVLIDYIIIDNHPMPLDDISKNNQSDQKKENFDSIFDDVEEDLDSIDANDLSIENDLIKENTSQHNQNIQVSIRQPYQYSQQQMQPQQMQPQQYSHYYMM